jgi:enamine deaminase RidA (YjgF/YER057c/UK114 family)
MTAESRLKELGITLPPAPEPKGLYKPAVIVGSFANSLVYTSGHLPIAADGRLVTGRLGADMDEPAGVEAARLAGLSILSTLRAALGDLDRVARLVKLLGVVNCTADFNRQPAVINGCSQLFADVFGADAGVGARSAIGVASLPLGAAVEIEAVFAIR